MTTENHTAALTDPTFRSDDVQEILGRVPPWLIRWGNTLFLLILFLILLLSWLIHYPEIVNAPFRLTSASAPQAVVAKSSGRIVKLLVADNQMVVKNQPLAFLESTASHNEILRLANAIDSLKKLAQAQRFESIATSRLGNFEQLGELQTDFQSFMQQFNETSTLFAGGYYQKKKSFLVYELSDLEQNHSQLLEQHKIQNQELKLSEEEYKIQKNLYAQKLIPRLEFHREESKFLSRQLPLKQLEMSITNNRTSQVQKQKEGAELDRLANEQKNRLAQAIHTLSASLAAWKVRYIATAPQQGQLSYVAAWQENQIVKAEEPLFYVGKKEGGFFGEIRLRQANFGKVKTHQEVLIKFPSYPFEQFGIVRGTIKSISAMPSSDSTYRAIIRLPHGLKTSADKTLPFKNGLNASAEIITEDQRVIERIFYQLKKIIAPKS
jgi:multidrug efflux pump subunit AcrA (membrane-fusion protein)